MTILITLTLAGIDTGPFDLYSDADNYQNAFETNVSRQDLLNGYTSNNAPVGTTTVRLDSTNQTCGSVDIYSCVRPNCDFTGEIICDITTTTTSTSSSSTTTTTTTSSGPGPITSLCLWSTLNEGTSGELGVYNIDTNVVTTVLVPNDFLVTQGVTRPICSTQNKLWLASETDLTQNNFIIREYDVTFTSGNVGLSFTRDITVSTQGILSYPGYSRVGSECTALTAINDTSIIIVFGGPTATVISPDVWGFTIDISQTGNIAKNLTSSIGRTVKPVINTYGKVVSNPRLLYLNNGDVITSMRMDGEVDGPYNGNYLQQYNISNNDRITGTMKLQDLGIPEFTVNYTSEKYIDIFSINSKLYALQPELNRVYEISQTPDYQQQSSNLVGTNVKSLSTTSGCADITLYAEPECESTTIPNMYDQAGDVYIGPVPFTYAGMTVMASSTLAAGSNGIVGTGGGMTLYKLCAYTGLVIAYDFVVQGSVFEIILTFAQPVNNIPITAAVLNTVLTEEGEFSNGDIYQVDTNTETPTLSISTGYGVKVIGNQFGGIDYYNNDNNGEFIVTCETDYTILTLSGQAPTGGPVGLGCTVPPLNCNRIFSEPSQGRDCVPGVCAPQNNWPSSGPEYKKLYSHNVATGVLEEIPYPAASAFTTPNSDVSETYLINQLLLTNAESLTTSFRFARYRYNESSTGVPQNLDWDGIVYEIDKNDLPGVFSNFIYGLSAINDDVISLNYQRTTAGGGGHMVVEAQFVPGSTTLAITEKFTIPEPFNGGSESVVTLNEDGTPNKFIALRSNEPVIISQFDYATGNFEGDVELSAPGNPENYRTGGDMCVIGDFLYISIKDLPNNNTDLWKVSFDTLEWSIAESDDSYNGGSSGSKPSCRISNGFTSFDPPPSTTTTSTTTGLPAGVKTIWTTFSAYTSPI